MGFLGTHATVETLISDLYNCKTSLFFFPGGDGFCGCSMLSILLAEVIKRIPD